MHSLATWQVGQVLWSLIWFYLLFIWIMLLFRVSGDIFRSRDLGGLGKAFWLFFIIVFPFLGIFLYLIARGDVMAQNTADAEQRSEAAVRDYVRDVAGTASSPVAEIERLVALRDSGAIDDAEFARLKAKITG